MGFASGCVIQKVGESLYIVGTSEQRCLASEFLKPILAEAPSYAMSDEMNNVSKLFVPNEKKGNLPDYVIAKVEQEFKTVIFTDDGASMSGIEDQTRFVVCGMEASKRDEAVAKLKELQEV